MVEGQTGRAKISSALWLFNNFGNKEFDKARGSEVELVLSKGAGDRISTPAAAES